MKKPSHMIKPGWGLVCLFVSLVVSAPINAMEPQGKPGLLGSWEFASTRLDALPLWRDVLQRIKHERPRIKDCDRDIDACFSPSMVAWRAKIKELQSESLRHKVEAINAFINTWPKHSDQEAYSKIDHWASPLEFLERSGDDEDFAIMKFSSLREAGLKNEQLRLVMVKDSLTGRAEIVLAAYIENEVLILSNQWPNVIRDDHAASYVPFISLNETTRWAHVPISTTRRDDKLNLPPRNAETREGKRQ